MSVAQATPAPAATDVDAPPSPTFAPLVDLSLTKEATTEAVEAMAAAAASPSEAVGNVKQALFYLQRQQAKWEREVGEAMRLHRESGVGVDAPLVDKEGFPRADIDVTSIRGARHTLAVRRTDLGRVGQRLALLLEALHTATRTPDRAAQMAATERARESAATERQDQVKAAFLAGTDPAKALAAAAASKPQVSATTAAATAAPPSPDVITSERLEAALRPFEPLFTVNHVTAAGPAELAGLRQGDIIYALSTVDDASAVVYLAMEVIVPGGSGDSRRQSADENIVATQMSSFAQLLRRSEGVPLYCFVKRPVAPAATTGGRAGTGTATSDKFMSVLIVPQRHAGEGLFGAALLPFSD